MQIYGTSQIHGPQSIRAPHSLRSTSATSTDSTSSVGSSDSVEISDAAQLMDQMSQIPDIRQDKVDSVRQQIADGTYETNDKLDIALSRLLDEIG